MTQRPASGTRRKRADTRPVRPVPNKERGSGTPAFTEHTAMDVQSSDMHLAAARREPDAGPARTFARRIDCAPSPRQPHAPAAPHGPGHGPPLDQAA
jgi:hypothetical protein